MDSAPTAMTYLDERRRRHHQIYSSISPVLEAPSSQIEHNSRTRLLSDQSPLRFTRSRHRPQRLSVDSDTPESEHSFMSSDSESYLVVEEEPTQVAVDEVSTTEYEGVQRSTWNGRLRRVSSGFALVQRSLSIRSLAASVREHITTSCDLDAQRRTSGTSSATTFAGSDLGNSSKTNSIALADSTLSGSTISNTISKFSSATTSPSIYSGPTLSWKENSRTSTKLSKELCDPTNPKISFTAKLKARLNWQREMGYLELVEHESEKRARKEAKRAKKEQRKKGEAGMADGDWMGLQFWL